MSNAVDVAMRRCKGACGQELPATPEYFHGNGMDNYGKPILRAECRACRNGRHSKPMASQVKYVTPEQVQVLALTDDNVQLLVNMETQRGNLTNMWRAAGCPENKDFSEWRRSPSTEAFIVALMGELKVEETHLLVARPGRDGGTWAHWQICAEYARYLSPAFAIRWNEYARRYLEQQARPTYQPTPQPIILPSPLSDIAKARSMASHVAETANAFLQALDMAGQRGVEFGDAMEAASPQVADIVAAMPELTHPKKAGFVYFTREPNDRHGRYKIGRSSDADKREGQIPGQMATVVRHVKVIRTDDCKALEHALHQHFKSQKYGKEWYRLSDQQVAAVCDLPTYFPSTRFRELSALLATEQIVQAALL